MCMHVGCISYSAGWTAWSGSAQREPDTHLADVYSVGLMLQWLMMIGMPQLPIDASLKAALKYRQLFAH